MFLWVRIILECGADGGGILSGTTATTVATKRGKPGTADSRCMAAFTFDYDPGTIVYGRDCVTDIGAELSALGARRALLVTGETVGSTPAVVDPVRDGMGDRLAAEFPETTPDKTLETAIAAAERVRALDADAIVALGGGSSLDVAKIASALAARGETEDDALYESFERTGSIDVPPGDLPPVVAVPTTLAGADLSVVAGITSRRDGLVRGGAFDGRLMPAALFYDPALFETTPHDVLCASAMNGFDKGIETLYSRLATPVTDGTAMRGLTLLARGLPRLGQGERDDQTLHDSIVGTVLVQYGCSRPDGLTLSLIHAFGHGIARGYAIQQGRAHGIIAPHVLEYLFDRVDGRRDLLAGALGVDGNGDGVGDGDGDGVGDGVGDGNGDGDGDDTEETAGAVIDAVTGVRDALELPSQLRDIEDMSEADLPAVAEDVHGDSFATNGPEGLDPTVEELEAVLRRAW